MKHVQTINSILEIQNAVVDALKQNVFFAKSKIELLSENAMDIDFQISKAIGGLGIVGVVQTPHLEFVGKDDDGHPVWQISEFQIVFTEIPTTNRSRADASTALDAALIAAETVNEEIPDATLVDIIQSDVQGMVNVVAQFKVSVQFGYKRTELN